MDPIGKIPILFLEDCICTQLDAPTTVLITQVTEWALSSLITGVRMYHQKYGH
jgi:hypothetical protein